MLRFCENCKYSIKNGGHCISRLMKDNLNRVCNYHEYTKGALEKQARLNIEATTGSPKSDKC